MDMIKSDTDTTAFDIETIQDVDLFADDMEERLNAGSLSSASTSSSASCAPSCASCGCTFSSVCSYSVAVS